MQYKNMVLHNFKETGGFHTMYSKSPFLQQKQETCSKCIISAELCWRVHSCCSTVKGQNPYCSGRTLCNSSLLSLFFSKPPASSHSTVRGCLPKPTSLIEQASIILDSSSAGVSPPSDLPAPSLLFIKLMGQWISIIVISSLHPVASSAPYSGVT